jgi:HSP20 family protein
MDNNDAKFFEQLVGAKAAADEELDVELAKASTAPTTSRAKSKSTMKEEKETNEEETELEMIAEAGDPSAELEGGPEGSLIVDVYQTPDDIVIQSAIAGIRPEDLDITATPDKITIRGARAHEKEVRDENYLCQECYWGRFSRSVLFPQEVDPENAQVTFKNGILTVRLPKASKKKTRKLRVKAD